MRLEYFQLIDRIVDLKLAERKISTEATVPATNTIFEGHFPGISGKPGKCPSNIVFVVGTVASVLILRSASLRSTMRSISWKYSRRM